MKEKTVIITGGNSGIGKETARKLAAQGMHVVIACRNPERGREALDDIAASTKKPRVELIPLDLASFASIRQFAEQIQDRFKHIDILINNAGLLPFGRQLTKEGFEMQFGVNHLGHFLLTDMLLPQLKAAPSARVINVASTMHNFGTIDFTSFKGETPYKPMKAYGQSKLANVLFTREFAQRYADTNITTYSLHPGGVGTNIAGRGFIRKWLYRFLGGFMTPARGAKTSVYLATQPNIEQYNGGYFNEFQKLKPGAKQSQNMSLAKKLWDVSEHLIKEQLFLLETMIF